MWNPRASEFTKIFVKILVNADFIQNTIFYAKSARITFLKAAWRMVSELYIEIVRAVLEI